MGAAAIFSYQDSHKAEPQSANAVLFSNHCSIVRESSLAMPQQPEKVNMRGRPFKCCIPQRLGKSNKGVSSVLIPVVYIMLSI